MVMILCYMAQMRVNEQITWLNKCFWNVIQVEVVWFIGGWGLLKTLVLKTQGKVSNKSSK